MLSNGTIKETKKKPEKEVKYRDSRGIFGVNTPQKPVNLPLSHLQKQRITPLLGAVQGRIRAPSDVHHPHPHTIPQLS